jgi:transcriptional regulator with GAF, ATPase, and Fis domain
MRVLAATNKDLRVEIRAGRFREDCIPAERHPDLCAAARSGQEDIPLLADHHGGVRPRAGRRVKGSTPALGRCCSDYPWPGNVRELRNVINADDQWCRATPSPRRISASSTRRRRRASARLKPRGAWPRRTLHEARDQFERDHILRTLAEQQGTCRERQTCLASSG